MKNNSLQSYKVQYRLKTELKTTNQIPISPLRMSSLVVVHCRKNPRKSWWLLPSGFSWKLFPQNPYTEIKKRETSPRREDVNF